ncbi:hypothetical protein MVEN_02131200 [Mycena venus]|uniref:Uncharacterized protein n=1 Tax=Mycena venus TaxID=2733690 RepID=A0A8H6X968_9AGAR|nr:hypothetical protein MVEN_02131200 [Mycena venus]
MAAPSTAATPDFDAIARTPSPDLTHLLTSNNVPLRLDSEIPFHDIISSGQNQLHVLNTQINILEVAPTRKHAEIVENIASIVLYSWHLGHICQYWRHAVLAYPALWSSIFISSFSPHFDEHPLLPMIETQLIRSGNAPLDVRWSSLGGGHMPDPRSAELVLAQCSHWKALCLTISHRFVQLDWLHAVSGRLVALETFEVASQYGVEIPDVCSGASRLRKIIFGGWQCTEYCPTIPWAQITHYSGIVRLGE